MEVAQDRNTWLSMSTNTRGYVDVLCIEICGIRIKKTEVVQTLRLAIAYFYTPRYVLVSL